jgi:hypothetical protein
MTLHERSMKLLKHRIRTLHHKHEFKFVFMGDCRGDPNENCYTMDGEFELVLKKAVQLNPLFIIHGGDCAYTGKKERLEHFVCVVERLAPNIPVFVAVGNHDLRQSSIEIFRQTIGNEHWVIDIPKFYFRCIALNNIINPDPEQKIYGFTTKEINYLEKRLQNSPCNTILTMHVQPSIGRWMGGSIVGFPVNTPESERFFDLIQQHHVKKVLVSHIHAYDEQFIRKERDGNIVTGDGIDFVLSGGAGAPIFKEKPLTLNDYNFVEFFVSRHSISSPILFRDFGTKKKPCI